MTLSLAALQEELPNFPTEVLEDWLLPYAKSEGWPPAANAQDKPRGRWRYLMRNEPLLYWRGVHWREVKRHVSITALRRDCQDILCQMVLGAVKGQHNLYSASIPDLVPRFNKVIEYLREYGVFPRTPVLLSEQDGLTVLDGNHRMAAYLYSYGYFKLDVDDKLLLNTKEMQRYWVGDA